MEFPESFILNSKRYTRESLLQFAAQKINAAGTERAQGTKGLPGTQEAQRAYGSQAAGGSQAAKGSQTADGSRAPRETQHAQKAQGAPKVQGSRAQMSLTPGWEIELYRFIIDFFNEEKTLVQQTSGTTGEPKTIRLDRDAMRNSAKRTLDHFEVQRGDAALLCLPVQYIAGKMMVVRALVGGLNLVTIEPSGNPGHALMQQEMQVDLAAMVPLQVYELLNTPEAFSRIGTLIIGGGETDPGVRKKIQKLRGIKVYETFAMSETYTHFATRRLNESASENSTGVIGEDSFWIMEGVKMELDERGCLVVDIPGVTDGAVSSNDLAEITGPRSFRWLGRLDNVIKTGGIKVIPETIEVLVKELTGREAAVLPVPDRRLGHKLVLVLEATEKETASSDPSEPLDHDHIIEALKSRLAAHEVPKEIRFLPGFPRNRFMKIDRKEIQRRVDMG